MARGVMTALVTAVVSGEHECRIRTRCHCETAVMLVEYRGAAASLVGRPRSRFNGSEGQG